MKINYDNYQIYQYNSLIWQTINANRPLTLLDLQQHLLKFDFFVELEKFANIDIKIIETKLIHDKFLLYNTYYEVFCNFKDQSSEIIYRLKNE